MARRKNKIEDLKPTRKPKSPAPEDQQLILCTGCGNELKKTQFYKSYNPAHATGIVPYCKTCWFNLCANGLGEVDKEKFKTLLMQNDKPYIHDLFVASLRDHSTPTGLVGNYIRRIALQQFRELTWSDSSFEPLETSGANKRKKSDRSKYILEELEDTWGIGFTADELIAFEKKYQFLTKGNPPTNEIHIDAIKTYVRYRVKADMATANNDVGAASKWGVMAEKQQTIAKLSPDKLSKNDLTGGLDNFATLMKEIELATDGVVPLLPRYLEQPKDKADFILFCYVNYNRNLRGLPDAEYRDIYEFYNRRADEVVFADEEDAENDGMD